jgi:hypothetical protein
MGLEDKAYILRSFALIFFNFKNRLKREIDHIFSS